MEVKKEIAELKCGEFEVTEGTEFNAGYNEKPIGNVPSKTEKAGLTVTFGYHGVQGAKAFFDYLSEEKSITAVYANGSYFASDDDAESIAKCIAHNKTLQVLDIHYSSLNGKGVKMIVKALANNTSLRYLNIRANDVSNDVLNDLKILLQSGKCKLGCLAFSQNNFAYEKALDKDLIAELDLLLKANGTTRPDSSSFVGELTNSSFTTFNTRAQQTATDSNVEDNLQDSLCKVM